MNPLSPSVLSKQAHNSLDSRQGRTG